MVVPPVRLGTREGCILCEVDDVWGLLNHTTGGGRFSYWELHLNHPVIVPA